MAKKKKAAQLGKEQTAQQKESSFWMITAIVAVILLVGVTVRTFVTSSRSTLPITAVQPATVQPIAIQPATSAVSNAMEEQVRQVAVNFKCACGGCGELPLAECQCDMPGGAVEEKGFIRTKLIEGYSVPQVVELLEGKYGHKAT